jgi:hypothetical protein
MTPSALWLAAAILGGGSTSSRPEAPVVEEQPLTSPTFVLFHTNDTRGYLDPCG